MKILILGGTKFLGRALVTAAQLGRHSITLFHRGQTTVELFDSLEHIYGDRRTDLNLLSGRTWDVVIDTCGYAPADVRQSARALAGAVGRYVFISSISAYADLSQPGMTEDAPLAQLPVGAGDDHNPEYYGPLKALCEAAVEEAMPGRALIFRPGLIVGPHDPSDRFTYWVMRIAQGEEVLAPADPNFLTQFIDVRDLADWILSMVIERQAGIYHVTGPREPLPLGTLLQTCQQACWSNARFTWLSEPFLLENDVQPWKDLPLWLPASDPTTAGLEQISIAKALHAGLTFRPLEDTIAATLTWAISRPAGHVWQAGLSRARETELLEKARACADERLPRAS